MEAEKKRDELKEHQAAQKAKQKAAKTNKKRKSGVLGDKSIEALAKRATTEEVQVFIRNKFWSFTRLNKKFFKFLKF